MVVIDPALSAVTLNMNNLNNYTNYKSRLQNKQKNQDSTTCSKKHTVNINTD